MSFRINLGEGTRPASSERRTSDSDGGTAAPEIFPE